MKYGIGTIGGIIITEGIVPGTVTATRSSSSGRDIYTVATMAMAVLVDSIITTTIIIIEALVGSVKPHELLLSVHLEGKGAAPN